ncbi:hypothetical protein MHC_03040 [Mycoplasma haemocanis str. Illinois]|uniref:Uncharacterized protein n=1 Tax=Mycoplasma haemocanis (strain Illinois) TaxID=1111676 RepID=H6N746_MYCHN|nr:hypothetical protein [Mycoplasma haemocanis]AEW45468.1 hypothetical protein MHC_03040 [Mycoplasma haemocanis str. Illinois]
MDISVFKLIALGGSAIIGGGTIASQAFFDDEKEQIQTQIQESVETPNEGVTCTIYKGEKEPHIRKLRKITDKLGSKEDFFKAREQDEKRIWNFDSLKREIETGCQRSRTHRIYIWYGPVYGKPDTWIFGSDISNIDWLKKSDVEIPEELKLKE